MLEGGQSCSGSRGKRQAVSIACSVCVDQRESKPFCVWPHVPPTKNILRPRADLEANFMARFGPRTALNESIFCRVQKFSGPKEGAAYPSKREYFIIIEQTCSLLM